jgi:hypothetical protein
MVMYLLVHTDLKALLSYQGRLSFGHVELFYNPISCLSSAVSAGNDWTAFSAPVVMSSVGGVLGKL